MSNHLASSSFLIVQAQAVQILSNVIKVGLPFMASHSGSGFGSILQSMRTVGLSTRTVFRGGDQSSQWMIFRSIKMAWKSYLILEDPIILGCSFCILGWFIPYKYYIELHTYIYIHIIIYIYTYNHIYVYIYIYSTCRASRISIFHHG